MTAPRKDAASQNNDFRANFTASVLAHLRAAFRIKRTAEHSLVPIHVDDRSDVDARRLDDVDDMDADACTEWLGTASSFVGMRGVMVVAMMLPSLLPTL